MTELQRLKKSNDGRPHVPEGDAGTTVFISQMDKIIKKKLTTASIRIICHQENMKVLYHAQALTVLNFGIKQK